MTTVRLRHGNVGLRFAGYYSEYEMWLVILRQAKVPIISSDSQTFPGEVLIEIIEPKDHHNFELIQHVRTLLLIQFRDLAEHNGYPVGGTYEQVVHNGLYQLMTLTTPGFQLVPDRTLTLADVDDLMEGNF